MTQSHGNGINKMTNDEKTVDFYVQAIIDKSKHYMERDEQLLRNAVRKLLDQYATKREIEKAKDQ